MADFNPYTDASLIDYLDDTCTFENASGSTPADGEAVAAWRGKLGVVAATTASALGTLTGPAYKASGAGGKPGLTCGAGKALSLGQPTAITNFLNAANPTYTAIVVFKSTSPGGFRFALTKSSNGNTSARLCLGCFPGGIGEATVGNSGLIGQPVAANQFVVAAIGGDTGTNRRGIRQITANGFGGEGINSAGTADTTSDIYIGAQGKTASPFSQNEFFGEIYAAFFFNRYLTPYEVKAATDQIHVHYSQTLPDAAAWHNLILECNSICNITDFVRIFSRLIADHPIYNIGWGGKKGSDQIAWFQQDYDALAEYLARNGKPIIPILHEITNDMQSGLPEAAYENNRRFLMQAAPHAWKRLVLTCIDRSVSTFPRDYLMRANGYLRRWWSQFADAICDFAGTPPDLEDWATSGFLTGDAVHPRSPYGMDPFRDKFASSLAALMNAPPSAAATWSLGLPDCIGPIGSALPAGQTSGNFYVGPSMGTAASAVATIASSNASDVLTSADPSATGSGGSSITLTWGSTGPSSWAARSFQLKPGGTTGARTISVTVASVVVASFAFTPRYYNSDAKALMAFALATTSTTRAKGQTSKTFGLLMATNTSTALGQLYGPTAAIAGTVTVTPSAGGTVNVVSGSTTWGAANGELFLTVTRDPGATSPITLTPASTIPGVTVPAPFDWHFDDTTSAVASAAPPATAPHTTNAADSYAGTIRVNNTTTGTVVVTPVDSLGRTVSPATLTFSPTVTCLPYFLAAGSPSGVHSITTTNNASLSNPSAVSFTDNAAPFAGDLGFTAVNPTSFTITSPTPTGGTGPFTYLFKYALEATGGVPGTFSNIAAASSSQTATLTGLTAATRYFVRCTVTDSATLATTSPIYDFTTSDLVAGVTSVTSITSTGAQATTTGGANGFGAKTYQAWVAPDVAGSPGAFSPSGSPGAPLTKTLSGLTASTGYWTQIATTDSHPLAPGTVFDPAVTFTTSAGGGSGGGEYDFKNQGYAMSTLGDYGVGQVVAANFGTAAALTGGAATVYRAASTAKSTAGVTLTAGLDSITGYNAVAVDTSADPAFYLPGYDYDVVLTAGTVSGTAQAGKSILSFSLRNRIEPVKSLPFPTSAIKSVGG